MLGGCDFGRRASGVALSALSLLAHFGIDVNFLCFFSAGWLCFFLLFSLFLSVYLPIFVDRFTFVFAPFALSHGSFMWSQVAVSFHQMFYISVHVQPDETLIVQF